MIATRTIDDINQWGALETFHDEMARGADAIRAGIEQQARDNPEHTDAILEGLKNLGSVNDCTLGHFGTAMMSAMAHALLTMPRSYWERFYWGYVQWSKSLPACPYKGREEENARGAMLMALADYVTALQRTLERNGE